MVKIIIRCRQGLAAYPTPRPIKRPDEHCPKCHADNKKHSEDAKEKRLKCMPDAGKSALGLIVIPQQAAHLHLSTPSRSKPHQAKPYCRDHQARRNEENSETCEECLDIAHGAIFDIRHSVESSQCLDRGCCRLAVGGNQSGYDV